MDAIISPAQKLSGTITAPSSKSHMLRALWIALLAKKKSQIFSPLMANDVEDTLRIIKQLGGNYVWHENHLEIIAPEYLYSQPFAPSAELFSGDSGISTRFVLPMLGLRKNF